MLLVENVTLSTLACGCCECHGGEEVERTGLVEFGLPYKPHLAEVDNGDPLNKRLTAYPAPNRGSHKLNEFTSDSFIFFFFF